MEYYNRAQVETTAEWDAILREVKADYAIEEMMPAIDHSFAFVVAEAVWLGHEVVITLSRGCTFGSLPDNPTSDFAGTVKIYFPDFRKNVEIQHLTRHDFASLERFQEIRDSLNPEMPDEQRFTIAEEKFNTELKNEFDQWWSSWYKKIAAVDVVQMEKEAREKCDTCDGLIDDDSTAIQARLARLSGYSQVQFVHCDFCAPVSFEGI